MPARTMLHSVTADGRVMHFFRRQDDHWVCECGETRSLDQAVLTVVETQAS